MDVVDDDITTGMLSVMVIKVKEIQTKFKVDTFPAVDGINGFHSDLQIKT